MTDIADTFSVSRPRARRAIRWQSVTDHAVLIVGSLLMILPVLAAFMTIGASDVEISRHGLQISNGAHLVENFDKALNSQGGFTGAITGSRMLLNSFILGIGFAIGKIVFGMMAAYAIVYFRLRFATFAFWVIFTTLLLPLEVRILPTYEVVHSMGLINTYTGLILPLIASATATFFFRQFFLSIPEELVEAARIDGAGPIKFFFDILLPLSRTMIAAIFIIMFVYGWNQYLWPTLITTDEAMFTLVRGIKQIYQQIDGGSDIPEFGRGLALVFIAILPPVLVVVIFQSWFVKGLVESDK